MNKKKIQYLFLQWQKMLLKTEYFSQEKEEEMETSLKKRIHLLKTLTECQEIMLINIGSNQEKYVNFDTIGPRIGSNLQPFCQKQNIACYGTMEKPLHAQNLKSFINLHKWEMSQKIVLATDAIYGPLKSYQTFQIRNTGFYPGSFENKKLPKVGNLSFGIQTIHDEEIEPTITKEEIINLSDKASDILIKVLKKEY